MTESAATMIALRFDHPLKAQECLLSMLRIANQEAIAIEDAAILDKDDNGRIRLVQSKDINPGQGASACATDFKGAQLLAGELSALRNDCLNAVQHFSADLYASGQGILHLGGVQLGHTDKAKIQFQHNWEEDGDRQKDHRQAVHHTAKQQVKHKDHRKHDKRAEPLP